MHQANQVNKTQSTLQPSDRPKRNFRSTLVEPFKQIKIGVYIIIISVAFVIATSYLFVSAFTEQYQHVMEIFNVVDPANQKELVHNDIFYKNALILGVLFVSFIVTLFTVVFKMTHRIYGPLISIERFVDQLSEGKYEQRIVIRRGDELQRLAQRLNNLSENLQGKHGIKDRRKGGPSSVP